MSLFPAETVTVALCPGQIGIIWRSRRGRGVRREVVTYSPSSAGNGWPDALESLAKWLDATPVRPGRISVVLSSRFVRLALIPWQTAYLQSEEEDALRRIHFEALYGNMQGWRFVSDPGHYGQVHVACAIPEALLIQVKALCSTRSMRCGAIVPYFVCAWNQSQRLVLPGQLWGVAESDSLVLGNRDSSGWTSLRVLLAKSTRDSLMAMVVRERVLQGCLEAHLAKLHVPGTPQWTQHNVEQGAQIEWLDLDAEPEAPVLAMARLMEGECASWI